MEWPKTVTGWVALGVATLALLGVGGVAGIWRWVKAPFDAKILKEREAWQAEIEKITDREHGYLALHRNALNIRIDEVARAAKQDIDNVGIRVNEVKEGTVDREARTRKLEERMRDSEHDRGTIHKELGALEADVKSFREEQNQMRIDIIAHIQEAKKTNLAATERVDARVQDVERKVAVLDDRQRRGEQQ